MIGLAAGVKPPTRRKPVVHPVRSAERLRRLEARDPGRWDGAAGAAFVGRARWHRGHTEWVTPARADHDRARTHLDADDRPGRVAW